MSEVAASASPRTPSDRDPGLGRRLVALMAARLALATVSVVVAVALDLWGGDPLIAERQGFYATVALAFLATAIYGFRLPHTRSPRVFAAVNLATDIAIASALVHFSGGPDSPFAFLYVLVAVYGALLFERGGALLWAAVCGLAYGAVLVIGTQGWLGPQTLSPPASSPQLLSAWIVHAGALLSVAVLASFLAAELRRTGEALHARTSDLSRLRSLHQRTLESLMSGLLTTDSARRITSFNPEAERITGVRTGNALGRHVEEVLPGIGELVFDAAEAGSGARSRARMPYRNRRGEELHLGVAAYVLVEAEADSGGYVVIFQDVTDVVEMEADLRRSERLAAVGELSASIAHEIRNPLAAISGSIQILQGQLGRGSDEPGRLMDIVLRETDRLNHLITDFLHYARPGSPKLESVSMEALFREVLEMFDAACPEGVRVATHVEPGLSLRADAAQLRQVVWNLVLNGAQAMPGGGTLHLEAGRAQTPPQAPHHGRRMEGDRKGNAVELVVRDEGGGIPAEVLERIFDPFFTTKRHGSGLGLATVHRIVQDHGGSIGVDSRVGHGTAVKVWLPSPETER